MNIRQDIAAQMKANGITAAKSRALRPYMESYRVTREITEQGLKEYLDANPKEKEKQLRYMLDPSSDLSDNFRFKQVFVRLVEYRARGALYKKPWKTCRYSKNNYINKNEYNSDKSKMYRYDMGLGEDLGTVDQLSRRIGHTGWYATVDGDESIIAHVVKLRCSCGILLIPVTVHTGSGSVIYYLSEAELLSKKELKKQSDKDWFDECVDEMANKADKIAEAEAEEDREADIQYRADCEAEELEEEAEDLEKEAAEKRAEELWSDAEDLEEEADKKRAKAKDLRMYPWQIL